MKGKRGIILGVANTSSIACSIAQVLKENGAEVILSYPNETIQKRVEPIAQDLGASDVIQCDVTKPETITDSLQRVKNLWGGIDFLVHSIAFSHKSELQGRFLDASLDNFLYTMNVSCYSLVKLCKEFEELFTEGSSVLTLSYYGAVKVIPNYNVMGVAKAALEASVRYLSKDLGPKTRINAISAGPIKTLAASAIGGFGSMMQLNAQVAPLRRNVTSTEVAKSSMYLLSDLASGVTGEVHYVDGGYNTVGMYATDQSA